MKTLLLLSLNALSSLEWHIVYVIDRSHRGHCWSNRLSIAYLRNRSLYLLGLDTPGTDIVKPTTIILTGVDID